MEKPTKSQFRTVDLDTLPEEDAKFYRADSAKIEAWRRGAPYAAEYRARNVCGEVAIFDCMDERQANTPETLGLPLGVFTPIRSAGNMLGEHNRNVELEMQRLIKRQKRLTKPGDELRPIMALFVTHSSKSRPHDDSCAAWGHRTGVACDEASLQVARMNRDYLVEGGGELQPLRFVVAFHIHALTDLEACIWHGNVMSVNPMRYVNGPEGDTRCVGLESEELGADIVENMRMAFPYADPRFYGLSREMWDGIIRQISDMFEANVKLVRLIAAGKAEASKQGHQGRRVLVGRGWEAYDETYEVGTANFTVSDFTKLDRDLAIAGKYVMANSIMNAVRIGSPVSVPYHINVMYGGWDDFKRQLDRCSSVRLGLGLGRDILTQWRQLAKDTSLRAAFRNDVWHAIQCKGGKKADLEMLDKICQSPESLLEAIRVYVSVAHYETHALELIATTEDVANS